MSAEALNIVLSLFFLIMTTDVVTCLMQQNMLFLRLAEVLSYIDIPVVKSELKPQLTG